MAEKDKTVEQEPTGSSDASEKSYVELAEEVKNLKQNYIPKEKYEQLEKDAGKLLNMMINDNPLPDNGKGEKKTTLDELNKMRKAFFANTERSNRETVVEMLKIRKAAIENGQPDPFVARGHDVTVTKNDIDRAEQLANFMQECLDNCEDDDGYFNALFNKRIVYPLRH